jgi:arylsulfatase A-like enzyme
MEIAALASAATRGCLAAAWLFAVASPGALAADRPHIVYVLADDLGGHDAGFRGGAVRTPHLDRLAASGAILNAFYVQPYSSQTRAALLTGRYPMRYGLQTLSVTRASRYGLALEERTLAQSLKAQGYRTAFVGEWLLGHAQPGYWPTRRGFDTFYGSLAGTAEALIRKGGQADWRRGERAVHDAGYVTELLATEAAALIRRHDTAAPLFLVVAFNAPARYSDMPQAALESYRDIADDTRRHYSAAVTGVDTAIGGIVAALEQRKMLDDTLIVFHSDNGGAVPTRFATGDGDIRNPAADNGVFREGMGSLYEGGVRVAALAHWPGRIAPKTVVTDSLHVTDLHATLLRLAGAAGDAARPPDGVDVWPVIAEGRRTPRKELLLDVEDFHGAIRVGEWKLIVHASLPAKFELFDIANDPGEAENQADAYPDRVRELLGRLNAHAYDMAPSLYLDALAPAASPAAWRSNPPKRY